MSKKKKTLKVAELFAGIGGFRIGLEGYPIKKNAAFEVVWSNQYEPRTKKQHANLVYNHRFKTGVHIEEDFEKLVLDNSISLPKVDLMVGGFPCQDFSIANRYHNKGLEGQKGKLWWSIVTFLRKLKTDAPDYLLLENVDRLLLSPSYQRGRDFAVILSSLNNLGYAVEWRVINAAEFGFPQRRRRVFILGYKKGTALYQSLRKSNALNWLTKEGVSAKAFPVCKDKVSLNKKVLTNGNLPSSTKEIMSSFSNTTNRFKKAGICIDGNYQTVNLIPDYKGKKRVLKDILLPEEMIPSSYYINQEDLDKWIFCKGAKVKNRVSKKTGKPYLYREGKVPFPDALDKPARTILTREGGTYIAREKHVVQVDGKYRRLHPIELERISGFPDDFSICEGVTDNQRAFFIGNALIVGVIEKLGKTLAKEIHTQSNNN